jgi:hypothetical protein
VLEQRKPVHPRHPNVEEYDVRHKFAYRSKGVGTIEGDGRSMAESRRRFVQNVRDGRLVINDQNADLVVEHARFYLTRPSTYERLRTPPRLGTLARMTAVDLESMLRIALPPLRLALRERYLVVRRYDPAAAVVAAEELAIVERIRARLARQGWWN